MRALLLFIIMTGHHRNSAGASGVCAEPPPPQKPNIKPVTSDPSVLYTVNVRLRYQCVDGYVRKAGTSNLIRCIRADNGSLIWDRSPSLVCIPDPNKPYTTRPPLTERTHTSSPFMTTRSSPCTQSSPVTTTAVNNTGHFTGISKSTIGGVAGMFIIILAAALLLLWWRLKHRVVASTNEIHSLHTYIPVSVLDSATNAAVMSTADAIHDTQ